MFLNKNIRCVGTQCNKRESCEHHYVCGFYPDGAPFSSVDVSIEKDDNDKYSCGDNGNYSLYTPICTPRALYLKELETKSNKNKENLITFNNER